MKPHELYHAIIQRAFDGLMPKTKAAAFAFDEPSDNILIQHAGFYPNRWVGFCDDYFGGGPPLDEWLKNPRELFVFTNKAHHTKGSCLTMMQVVDGQLNLHSRASNWVPTGILDLKLLNMCFRRLEVSNAVWIIDDLQLDPMSVAGYHRFGEMTGTSDFYKTARRVLDETPHELLDKRVPGMLGRHKKAIRRGRQTLTTDESRIDAFTLVIPRDFAWAATRHTREQWVTKQVGRRGYGEYQWDRLDYPELEPVVARLPPGMTIEQMATRRAARG